MVKHQARKGLYVQSNRGDRATLRDGVLSSSRETEVQTKPMPYARL